MIETLVTVACFYGIFQAVAWFGDRGKKKESDRVEAERAFEDDIEREVELHLERREIERNG